MNELTALQLKQPNVVADMLVHMNNAEDDKKILEEFQKRAEQGQLFFMYQEFRIKVLLQ